MDYLDRISIECPILHFKGSRGLAIDFRLGPVANGIGKILMFYLKLGKINCDVISKHINNFVIFIHKNFNCRPV